MGSAQTQNAHSAFDMPNITSSNSSHAQRGANAHMVNSYLAQQAALHAANKHHNPSAQQQAQA